jgi:hypothetical protein
MRVESSGEEFWLFASYLPKDFDYFWIYFASLHTSFELFFLMILSFEF